MAPTLTFVPPSTSLAFGSLVPPPSQEFAMQQMPNVFVIPPEEEQDHNPPWCYFDATQAAKNGLRTSPDMDALDVALRLCQQTDNRAPTFSRTYTNESQETIVMPRRSSFMKLTGVDADMEEEGLTDIRARGGVRRFDEEIVEVVKVRRNEGMSDVGDGRKMKKSNTFRARASQALRSIGLNVGGGKAQRRASVSEHPRHAESESQAAATLPTRRSCQQELGTPRPTSPSISRRRSLTLGQLFNSFKENQGSRPATPSADELMSPTSPTLVATESAPPTRPMSPVESIAPPNLDTSPGPPLEDCVATSTKSSTLLAEPPELEGSAKPTLSKRKSFRRRLSVLELQKIFTLGGSSASSPSDTSAQPQEIANDMFSPLRAKSMDSAGILSSSSSRTSTSTAATAAELASRPSSGSHMSETIRETDDDELEMRLDSLHFDSLHFDPEEILKLSQL
ncbi:hypothetical protein C8Q74DRAFT_50477 [Fomes fomentarius]|nr:hypothetical protein C8Q74DRAFT_50477 [Fomes fomentarius]